MGPLGVREPHVLKPDISAWQGWTAACVPAPCPEKLPATNVNWHICEVICFCFYFVFSKEVLTKESLACFHQSHVHFNASFGVCWAGAESCAGRNKTYFAIVSLDASSLSLSTIAGDTAESTGKAVSAGTVPICTARSYQCIICWLYLAVLQIQIHPYQFPLNNTLCKHVRHKCPYALPSAASSSVSFFSQVRLDVSYATLTVTV